LPALLLACFGAAWLLLPRGTPGKVLAALLFLPMLWPGLARPERGEVDIVMLDVGQGLSVLVLTEQHSLLVDAGPALPRAMDYGETVVLPALRALGVNALDGVVLSHGDNDHAGGWPTIRRAHAGPLPFAPEGMPAAIGSYRPCVAGSGWQWDDVRFEFLHPTPHFPYLRNDSSCVLRIRTAHGSVLLPGDIGRHVEARLLYDHGPDLQSEVLLVPHHGSGSSSSWEFVAAVRPQVALASMAAGNRFGHPAAEVVARYREHGAEWLDTAASGAVRLRVGVDGVQITERWRQDRPRYWRDARSSYARDLADHDG
jgi:competence protein ComEC